jgi:hypothetical protein
VDITSAHIGASPPWIGQLLSVTGTEKGGS